MYIKGRACPKVRDPFDERDGGGRYAMHKSILTLACLVWLTAVDGPPLLAGEPTRGVDPTAWASLEYLNLWTSSAPLPFPLVTSGDAAGGGRLNAPSTRVLLGDGPLATGPFPGFRATLGAWFDFDENFGGEISGFATGLRAAHFQAASNGFQGPLLAIPFADVTSGVPQESSLVVAQPGTSKGRISADDATIFGGLEVDGLINLSDFLPSDDNRLSVVAGVRFLTYKERFQFDSVSIDTTGFTFGTNDVLLAQNTFFGGDLGLRGSRRFQRLTLELTGKAALGPTWQAQYVSNQSNLQFFPPRIQQQPNGGFFTQPSNIGYTYPHRTFSVVPAARLRAGYDLTRNLRLTVSYEAMLWTRMMRPSNELDRQINLSQITGPLAGVARPAVQNRHSDFWAQGFTVGLQLQY
jgi:hypothetical protein